METIQIANEKRKKKVKSLLVDLGFDEKEGEVFVNNKIGNGMGSIQTSTYTTVRFDGLNVCIYPSCTPSIAFLLFLFVGIFFLCFPSIMALVMYSIVSSRYKQEIMKLQREIRRTAEDE